MDHCFLLENYWERQPGDLRPLTSAKVHTIIFQKCRSCPLLFETKSFNLVQKGSYSKPSKPVIFVAQVGSDRSSKGNEHAIDLCSYTSVFPSEHKILHAKAVLTKSPFQWSHVRGRVLHTLWNRLQLGTMGHVSCPLTHHIKVTQLFCKFVIIAWTWADREIGHAKKVV